MKKCKYRDQCGAYAPNSFTCNGTGGLDYCGKYRTLSNKSGGS